MNRCAVVSSMVALTGCVDVHDFPDRTVTAAMAGAGATVAAHGYSMGFSDHAFHFPTSFKVGTTEMLGGGVNIDNTDESFIGLSFYPAMRIDGDSVAAGVTPQSQPILIDLAGSHVAKVRLLWAASACGGAFGTLGRTTFTFFPDGRITRYDHVTTAASVQTSSCPGAATTWFVTSFTTLNRIATMQVGPASIPTDNSIGFPADQFECALGAHTIGFGWIDAATRVRAPNPETVAFTYDLSLSGGPTLPPVDTMRTSTIIVDDGASCDALAARMFQYTASTTAQLVVSGNPVGLADDGIYGGAQGDGVGGMQLADPHVTLGAQDLTVPGGFAVWLDFGALVTGFDVSHSNPPPSPWYAYDLVSDRQAVFWFASDLAPGDTISITPR